MDNKYEIGTITSGRLIGGDSHLFVWLKCDVCGVERWVQLQSTKQQKHLGRCPKCMLSNKEHGDNWKGGRVWGGGKGSPYIMVWVKKDNFFYPMVVNHKMQGGGYISEHRLVMANHLGRCLHGWEIVHHRNGIRTDNRIENLQIMSDIGHRQVGLMERKIKQLTQENQSLREKLQEVELA